MHRNEREVLEMDSVNAEEVLKNLFVQITESHLKPEFSSAGIKAALVEIMELSADLVKSVYEAQAGAGVDCEAGCSYCCYSQIKLMPAEALLIFSWIEDKFKGRDQDLLEGRIRNNRQITEGKSLESRVMVKESSPCIFLEEGNCSIYPVRPLICRSWASYSRSKCIEAFGSGNHNAEIETSSSSNYVFYVARETVRNVCRSHGLESEPLELPRAMDCCLSVNDPFARWLRGEPVFDKRIACQA